jgi:hypothetical protein
MSIGGKVSTKKLIVRCLMKITKNNIFFDLACTSYSKLVAFNLKIDY